ncbi:unnamed protein product [Merluccius merluccius]
MDAIIASQPNRGHPCHPAQRSGCLTIAVTGPCFHCDQNDRQDFIFTFGLGFLRRAARRSPFRSSQWIRSRSLIGGVQRSEAPICLFICHLRPRTPPPLNTTAPEHHRPGHRSGPETPNLGRLQTMLGKERTSWELLRGV